MTLNIDRSFPQELQFLVAAGTHDSTHPMQSNDYGLATIDSGSKIPPTSPTALAG